MRKQRPDAGLDVTPVMDVGFGAFDLSEFRLPYMTSIISMERAANYLNLVKDDPTYAQQDWTIEELYQREVDYSRVRKITDKYLVENSRRPQFFNSLTVVLRPRPKYEGAYEPPSPEGRLRFEEAVGPIRVEYDKKSREGYPRSGSYGEIKWNAEQVWATAIDGQHRLAAIRELQSRDKNRLHGSYVSVIFIVLDERVGFEAREDWDEMKTMRSVFIDLNKRAVPVTRARNLLLDDLNPKAEFVRQLMGERLQFESTDESSWSNLPIGKDQEFLRRLPLELVDWHGESKAKVDRGPYVTSVLALDWIVDHIVSKRNIGVPERFDLDTVEDDEEYNKIRSVLEKWPRAWSESIKADWDEAKNTRTHFHLTHEHVEELGKDFSTKWGRPITRLLTQPIPYRKVCEKRLASDTLTPEFGQWYQAKAEKERNKRSKFSEYYEDQLNTVRSQLTDEGIEVSRYNQLLREI